MAQAKAVPLERQGTAEAQDLVVSLAEEGKYSGALEISIQLSRASARVLVEMVAVSTPVGRRNRGVIDSTPWKFIKIYHEFTKYFFIHSCEKSTLKC